MPHHAMQAVVEARAQLHRSSIVISSVRTLLGPVSLYNRMRDFGFKNMDSDQALVGLVGLEKLGVAGAE